MMIELLEHNDFLTLQSQQIRDFYKFMADKYPFLAFTFKGRIKSLIRLEEKINGNIVEFIHDYYSYLYAIANALPDFLETRGFEPELSGKKDISTRIDGRYKQYYRDYIEKPNVFGYRSLHISFFDNSSRSNIEVQLRTKQMDDVAEIGPANHLGYEERQEKERARRMDIPVGVNQYFDDAYERGMKLQQLDLNKVDVNMFGAVNNSLVNDGCGLYRGRLILPYEHLSRFQNDLIG